MPSYMSVVVAAWGGAALLRQCLAHLDAERARSPAGVEVIVEVIAATSLSGHEATGIASDFPWARIESVPGGTVFTLRARGVALARGALVAIIEDHMTVAPGWMSALQQAHADGHGLLGGPVDNGAVGSTVDWALYFVKSGMQMPPALGGAVASVSGVNVACDATLLQSCRDTWQVKFHENDVNDALVAIGQHPWMVRQAVVSTHLPMSFGAGATFVMLGAWAAGEFTGYAMPQAPREALRA